MTFDPTQTHTADVGRHVECDLCGNVLTDDAQSGGFIFTGKGVGPCCAERFMATIKSYGEEEFIRGECPDGVSFADWIRSVRAAVPGGNTLTITTF
jgi:hypothetical protein